MTTNPRRLVAMIEATDKDYTITNFLPDIKITYNAGLDRFEIEEIRDYINIAYAPNISDVTLIVGQNGTGKTSLLRKVFKGINVYLSETGFLIFKTTNGWSVRGRSSVKLYHNNKEVTTYSQIHRTPGILLSTALEYRSPIFPKQNYTSVQLLSESLNYHSLVMQDTTNQLLFLLQKNKNGESYKNLTSPFLNLNKKRIKLNLDTEKIKNDKEYWKILTKNREDKNYNNSYKVKNRISVGEFFEETLNLKKLRNILYPHLHQVNNLIENFNNLSTREFENYWKKFLNDNIIFFHNEEPNFNIDKILKYKNAEDEIQQTIYIAYKKCLVSLLSYDKQRLDNLHISRSALNDDIINNTLIPTSIIEDLRLVISVPKDKDFELNDIISAFLHYSSMSKQKLFQELLTLSSESAWHSWLEAFDAVFNYSGTQPHALFDLESEAFQEFLNHLTDDIFMASGSNRTILNNFLHFLTLPVPQVTEHTKLLTQLQSYLTFEWDGLSSGELSLLNQLGRLHAAKQSIKSKHVVLLIDELDLGLHPEWQRRWVRHMLPLIGHIFEDHQVQIIMTTHSPIVLSDIYKDNIIFLKKGPQGQPMVVNNAERQETFGQNIHELFADSFFLGDDSGSVRGDYATNLLNLVIDLLYKKLSHPRDCQQETTNLLQALNLPDDTNEETLKAYLKKIITSTGEPIIAQKLLEMYQEAFSTVEEKIAELEKEIERLRKGASQDD